MVVLFSFLGSESFLSLSHLSGSSSVLLCWQKHISGINILLICILKLVHVHDYALLDLAGLAGTALMRLRGQKGLVETL